MHIESYDFHLWVSFCSSCGWTIFTLIGICNTIRVLSNSKSYDVQFQASDFLLSSGSNGTVQEREMDENIYSNEDFSDTASLLEQVITCVPAPVSVSSPITVLFCPNIIFRSYWLFFPISCINYLKLLSFWFLFQDMHPGPSNQSGVRFISGIICKSKVLTFERMLFRATRGNMFFNQATADDQIMDPLSNEMVMSTYLLIVFF